MVKRSIDIFIAIVVISTTSPLWVLTAVLIKLTSSGSVFYRQRRVGLHGAEFDMLKFRTMTVGSDSVSLAQADDPRITKIGSILRPTSLDELPQLINVLWGEMSICGPRPPLPEMVPYYTADESKRLNVRPGLTGWAQINGRNRLPYHERLRLDQWYVEHFSVWIDLFILIKTVPVLFSGRGMVQDDPRPWENRPLDKCD